LARQNHQFLILVRFSADDDSSLAFAYRIRIAEMLAYPVEFLSSVTSTVELDLDSVKMNQHAKYSGQRSFLSRIIIVRTY